MALKYFDELGVDTIPDNTVMFHDPLYDYEIRSSNNSLSRYFKESYNLNGKIMYKGYLSEIFKGVLRSERLHQELLWYAFPQYWDTNNRNFSDSSFGARLTDCERTYNSYANAYGLPKYKFFYDLGTCFYPEKLFSGNPCIVGIKKGAPKPNSAEKLDVNHAVLGYGYTGTRNIITTVDEIICNYGWESESENGAIFINSSFVTENICMAGFKWR